MKKALLFLLGGGLLAYAFYAYYEAEKKLLGNIKVAILSFTKNTLSVDDVNVDFQLKFTSSADIQATIKKIYLEIYFNGVQVGTITDTSSFILPAHGSSIAKLNLDFNPKQFLSSILTTNFLNFTGTIRMAGYAVVNSGFINAQIPLDFTTTLAQILSKNQ